MTDCTPALVLSGGGARGAYQVGVLRHIARRFPDLKFRIITGVSAGAINATFLAGRCEDFAEATDDLAERWCSLSTARVMRSDIPSLLGNSLRVASNLLTGGSRLAPPVRGLVDTGPLRKFLAPLLDPGRPFSDRYSTNNAAVIGRLLGVMPGTTHRAMPTQMCDQLLLQGPAGLDKQSLVDRLVGHPAALIVWILALKPAGNLPR